MDASLKIALLGYGRLGKEIEKTATGRGHRIILTIDIGNTADLTVENLRQADVAIDFSTPGSAFSNITRCFEAGVPVVSGTTGWMDKLDEARSLCVKMNQTFFYASNFSLGVNLFFAVNRYLARLMNQVRGYEVRLEEIHHVHKLDAPSGTAITLANDLIAALDHKTRWNLGADPDPAAIQVTARREDEVPGTHIITYDSSADTLEISHTAKNRKGFALGAVLAAEFIADKKGVFSMSDLIKLE